MRLDFQIAFHFNNWLFSLLHLSFWPTKQLRARGPPRRGAHQGAGPGARALLAIGLTGSCLQGGVDIFTVYVVVCRTATLSLRFLSIVLNFKQFTIFVSNKNSKWKITKKKTLTKNNVDVSSFRDFSQRWKCKLSYLIVTLLVCIRPLNIGSTLPSVLATRMSALFRTDRTLGKFFLVRRFCI